LRKDDDTMRNYQLRIQTGPGVALLSFTSGGQPNWRDALGKIRVDDEQWHHVVATYDMEFERIYVDGVLDVQKACRDEPDTNTAPLLIGRVHGEDFMKGLIDELFILNEPLQEEDIQVLMEGLEDIAKGATVDSLEKLSTTWGSVKAQY
jgi:hypothetical protein